jgi:DNA-binding response OmpR family regulator
MASRVLIIEDEVVTQHLLARLIESEGHPVSVAQSCAEAEALAMRETYGLILLDLVLGNEDGLAILRRIRARQRGPIVIISGKSDSTDIITGLELGADDYVLKPFDVAVLRARLRGHLRRAERPAEPAEESIALGNIVVDCGLRDALVDGQPAGLTQKEFQLLLFLARRIGRAVRKEDIEDEIFEGEMRSDKILAVYVRRLREKLEADPQNPRYLHTVRGFGYRLAADSTENLIPT